MSDGLTRREVEFPHHRVTEFLPTETNGSSDDGDDRNEDENKYDPMVAAAAAAAAAAATKGGGSVGSPNPIQNIPIAMQAYVVGGRDVLNKRQKQQQHVIVFLPNRLGYKHKSNRIAADELAFLNQAVVVVPDIYPNGQDGM